MELRDVSHVVITRQPLTSSPGVYPAQAFVSLTELQGEPFLSPQKHVTPQIVPARRYIGNAAARLICLRTPPLLR